MPTFGLQYQPNNRTPRNCWIEIIYVSILIKNLQLGCFCIIIIHICILGTKTSSSCHHFMSICFHFLPSPILWSISDSVHMILQRIFKDETPGTMITWEIFLIMLRMLAINMNLNTMETMSMVFTIGTFLVIFNSMFGGNMWFQRCPWVCCETTNFAHWSYHINFVHRAQMVF